MLRILALALIAGTPGLVISEAANAPIIGWAVSVGLVVIALGIARQRAAAPTSIATSATGWLVLEREVARARRYGQALSLIRIDDAAAPIRLSDVAAAGREIDLTWRDDGIWLLAVGADEAGRQPLMARLRVAIPLIDAERMQAMSFPGDAMTVRALIRGLTSGAERPIRLPVRPVEALDDLAYQADALSTQAEGGA